MLKFVPDKNGVVVHGTSTSIGGGGCAAPGGVACWMSTRIASGSVIALDPLVAEDPLDELALEAVGVVEAPVVLAPVIALLLPLICQLVCHCAPS